MANPLHSSDLHSTGVARKNLPGTIDKYFLIVAYYKAPTTGYEEPGPFVANVRQFIYHPHVMLRHNKADLHMTLRVWWNMQQST